MALLLPQMGRFSPGWPRRVAKSGEAPITAPGPTGKLAGGTRWETGSAVSTPGMGAAGEPPGRVYQDRAG